MCSQYLILLMQQVLLSQKLEDIKSIFAFASLEMLGKPALFLTAVSDAGQVQPRFTLNLIRILVTLSSYHRQ